MATILDNTNVFEEITNTYKDKLNYPENRGYLVYFATNHRTWRTNSLSMVELAMKNRNFALIGVMGGRAQNVSADGTKEFDWDTHVETYDTPS